MLIRFWLIHFRHDVLRQDERMFPGHTVAQALDALTSTQRACTYAEACAGLCDPADVDTTVVPIIPTQVVVSAGGRTEAPSAVTAPLSAIFESDTGSGLILGAPPHLERVAHDLWPASWGRVYLAAEGCAVSIETYRRLRLPNLAA